MSTCANTSEKKSTKTESAHVMRQIYGPCLSFAKYDASARFMVNGSVTCEMTPHIAAVLLFESRAIYVIPYVKSRLQVELAARDRRVGP